MRHGVLFAVSLAMGAAFAAEPANDNANDSAANATAVVARTGNLRGAHAGKKSEIDYWFDVKPNCESAGYPEIIVTTAPKHGKIILEKSADYPMYGRDNIRFECNKRKVPVMRVFYQSEPGFRGIDVIRVRALFAQGYMGENGYDIEVF